MERLNLTLDNDTSERLARHAKRAGAPRAAYARGILRDALEAREALERRKKLAADYVAGRSDAQKLLKDLEAALPTTESAWYRGRAGSPRRPSAPSTRRSPSTSGLLPPDPAGPR